MAQAAKSLSRRSLLSAIPAAAIAAVAFSTVALAAPTPAFSPAMRKLIKAMKYQIDRCPEGFTTVFDTHFGNIHYAATRHGLDFDEDAHLVLPKELSAQLDVLLNT